MTPEERKLYNQRYYQENKARLAPKRRAYDHQYYLDHKEHLKKYNHHYHYRKKEERAMGEIIDPDGEVTLSKPANGKTYSLEELQTIVGGYIEIVRLKDGKLMVLNEEGKLKGLLYNKWATEIARGTIFDNDVIVGTVLVCPANLID